MSARLLTAIIIGGSAKQETAPSLWRCNSSRSHHGDAAAIAAADELSPRPPRPPAADASGPKINGAVGSKCTRSLRAHWQKVSTTATSPNEHARDNGVNCGDCKSFRLGGTGGALLCMCCSADCGDEVASSGVAARPKPKGEEITTSTSKPFAVDSLRDGLLLARNRALRLLLLSFCRLRNQGLSTAGPPACKTASTSSGD
mmetsp:Transcript_22088/g.61569  ORF Transcript_22088/g.61569 Transcript_22088/m.61569 type:complete len:201 (-) Transcript_22088:568-1170(-)